MLRVDAPVRILNVQYGTATSMAKFVPTMDAFAEEDEISDKDESEDEGW